jgi:hypothetical protein
LERELKALEIAKREAKEEIDNIRKEEIQRGK